MILITTAGKVGAEAARLLASREEPVRVLVRAPAKATALAQITSKASADSPIARRRDQTEIENGLIVSGLGYTLLRSNAYMQNFLMLAPAIAKTSSFGSSAGDARVGAPDRQIAFLASGRCGDGRWPLPG